MFRAVSERSTTKPAPSVPATSCAVGEKTLSLTGAATGFTGFAADAGDAATVSATSAVDATASTPGRSGRASGSVGKGHVRGRT